MDISAFVWLALVAAAAGLDLALLFVLRRWRRFAPRSAGSPEVLVLGLPSPILTWLRHRVWPWFQARWLSRPQPRAPFMNPISAPSIARPPLGVASSISTPDPSVSGAAPAPSRAAPDVPPAASEPDRPTAHSAPEEKLPAQLAGAVILAGLIMVFGTQWSGPMAPGSSGSEIALTLAGMALFVLGVRLVSSEAWTRRLVGPLAWLGARLQISPVQVLFLALSPLLSLLASSAAGFAPLMRSPVIAVLAWVGAILLAAVGGWRAGEKRLTLSREALAWTLAWIVLALLVRGAGLGGLPDTLSGDEGASGLDSAAFVRGARNNIFDVAWQSWPALHNAINAVPIALFGQSSAALRAASALAGALAVGALYLLARAMFGPRAAWLAAAYLTVMALHVQWSRTALNNIWDSLVYTVALAALWSGWHTGRRQFFLLAGLAWGFSLYFYASARALVVLLPALVVTLGLLDRPRLRRAWPDLVLMALTAFVVVWPLAWFFLNHLELFLGPMKLVSILGPWLEFNVQQSGQPAWMILLRQLSLGLQAYTFVPLIGWLPDTRLLPPLAATFFLLGLALLVSRLRDSRSWIPTLWLLTFSLVSAFSVNTPQHWRFIGVLPACALVVGFGADQVLTLAERLWARLARFTGALALALALLLGAAEFRVFWDYNFNFDNAGYGAAVASRLGNYLRAKTGEWQVAFYGWPRLGWGSIPSLQYLTPHIVGYDMTLPDGSMTGAAPTSSKVVYVFLTAQVARLDEIRAQHPGGLTIQETWPYEEKLLYWLYEYDGTAP